MNNLPVIGGRVRRGLGNRVYTASRPGDEGLVVKHLSRQNVVSIKWDRFISLEYWDLSEWSLRGLDGNYQIQNIDHSDNESTEWDEYFKLV